MGQPGRADQSRLLPDLVSPVSQGGEEGARAGLLAVLVPHLAVHTNRSVPSLHSREQRRGCAGRVGDLSLVMVEVYDRVISINMMRIMMMMMTMLAMIKAMMVMTIVKMLTIIKTRMVMVMTIVTILTIRRG